MIKQFSTSVLVFKDLETPLEILVIFHRKLNKWMVPGGHVEETENPMECAIREVKEETGIDIKPISLLHEELPNADSTWILAPEYLFEQIIPATARQPQHIHIDCVYLGLALNTDICVNYTEVEGVRWVPVEGLAELDMFDGTRKVIGDVVKRLRTIPNFYNLITTAYDHQKTKSRHDWIR